MPLMAPSSMAAPLARFLHRGGDANHRAADGRSGVEEHQMALQRRDLILFQRIEALDRRDHVVAKAKPMNTFEVE
jgi:hypothetical protein